MPPGTSVLLYTDGLIERRDESLDSGLERLRSTGEQVLHGTALNDEITDLLGRVIDGPRPADDVALMLLHRDATPATELEFAVDARARSLLTIRRAVSRWLEDLEVPRPVATEIVMAVHEASANVVEHAYGPAGGTITITAKHEGDEVEVLDPRLGNVARILQGGPRERTPPDARADGRRAGRYLGDRDGRRCCGGGRWRSRADGRRPVRARGRDRRRGPHRRGRHVERGLGPAARSRNPSRRTTTP